MKYEERAAFEQADAFGIGAPNDAYAQYFVGDSFLHPLIKVVDRSLSVPPARVYIRSGAKNRRFCIRGMWYILNRV